MKQAAPGSMAEARQNAMKALHGRLQSKMKGRRKSTITDMFGFDDDQAVLERYREQGGQKLSTLSQPSGGSRMLFGSEHTGATAPEASGAPMPGFGTAPRGFKGFNKALKNKLNQKYKEQQASRESLVTQKRIGEDFDKTPKPMTAVERAQKRIEKMAKGLDKRPRQAKTMDLTFGLEDDTLSPVGTPKKHETRTEKLLRERRGKKSVVRTGINMFLDMMDEESDEEEGEEGQKRRLSRKPSLTRRSSRMEEDDDAIRRHGITVGGRKSKQGGNVATSPAVRDMSWNDTSVEQRSLHALQKVRDRVLQKHKGLQQAFDGLDRDRAGYVTQGQWESKLTMWGVSAEEASLVFKLLDVDRSGQVRSTEFVSRMRDAAPMRGMVQFRSRILTTHSTITNCIDSWDEESTGFLTPEQFKKGCLQMSITVEDARMLYVLIDDSVPDMRPQAWSVESDLNQPKGVSIAKHAFYHAVHNAEGIMALIGLRGRLLSTYNTISNAATQIDQVLLQPAITMGKFRHILQIWGIQMEQDTKHLYRLVATDIGANFDLFLQRLEGKAPDGSISVESEKRRKEEEELENQTGGSIGEHIKSHLMSSSSKTRGSRRMTAAQANALFAEQMKEFEKKRGSTMTEGDEEDESEDGSENDSEEEEEEQERKLSASAKRRSSRVSFMIEVPDESDKKRKRKRSTVVFAGVDDLEIPDDVSRSSFASSARSSVQSETSSARSSIQSQDSATSSRKKKILARKSTSRSVGFREADEEMSDDEGANSFT